MRHLKRAVTLFAEIGAPGTMEPEVWKLVEWQRAYARTALLVGGVT